MHHQLADIYHIAIHLSLIRRSQDEHTQLYFNTISHLVHLATKRLQAQKGEKHYSAQQCTIYIAKTYSLENQVKFHKLHSSTSKQFTQAVDFIQRVYVSGLFQ